MSVNLARPRIFLTPAVLARANQRVATGDPRWLDLKAHADEDANWTTRPIDYAAAYALTGNPAYADRAIQLAGVFVGQGIAAIEDDDGYACRLVLPEEAIIYDWCYDRLTPLDRVIWRDAMEAQCRLVWPETGGTLANDWGGWPSSNYFHGFQMTWLVGLALAGESSLAADLIAQGLARHQKSTMPRMTKEWAGGYLEEGTSYGVGSLMWMAHYLTAHLTATGDAPSRILDPAWYPSVLRALIHLTTPSLDHLYPGGDEALESTGRVTDYTRAPVLAMMDALLPTAAGYAQQWLAETAAARYPIASTLWMPLLWQSDAPAIDYHPASPLTYSMPGVGVYSARSDWTPGATHVVAVAGDVIEDSHQDQTGSVMLWRGAWLAAAAKLASHDGTEHDAPNLNTVVIGGKAQPAKTDGCRAFLIDAQADHVSWAADLTPANAALLVDHRREWLFLPPTWLVLLDRIRTKDAGASKEWRLHTLKAPNLRGMTYWTAAGAGKLFGTAILPDTAPTLEVVATGGYRIKHARSGETLSTFLHVWEAAPSTQSAPSPVASSAIDATHLILSLAGKAISVDLSLDTSQAKAALTLAGSAPPVPPDPPPAGALTVAVTAASSSSGATFSGTVADTAPLPAGSVVTVTARTPDGRSGSGSATIAGSTPPPGPTILLSETFDGTAPSSLWVPGVVVSGAVRDPSVPVVVGSGVLTITPRANTDGQHYNGLVTAQTYDLTGAAATVEVPSSTTGSANTQFGLVLDAKNFYLIETESGQIYFAEVVGGVRSDNHLAYGGVSHRFWRIRHQGKTITWETSAEGTAWVMRRSVDVRLGLMALKVELAAGTWERVSNPSKATFDNVKIERLA